MTSLCLPQSIANMSIRSISTGTGVELVGKWRTSPTAKSQTHELETETLEVVGQVDAAVRMQDREAD